MRMGLAFSIVGFSMLIGTPMEGALLHHRNTLGRFSWDHSIILCGVSRILHVA
jgi:MCP family monocarboxylic acid transporter-like MFS transporter 10